MWFKLVNANFGTNSLGKMSDLSNSWQVYLTYSGGISKASGSGSVTKGGTWTGTFTLADGATFTSVTLSSGSASTPTSSVSGSTVTVTVANVASDITLALVATGGSSSGGSGGGEPTNYTFTVNPTPTSATVTLSATGYSTVTGTGSKSITVANGTTVNWSVSASGYISQSGTYIIANSDHSLTVSLDAEATTTATLTVNRTPSDAKVTLYAKGYSQSGTSITVPNDGTVSPTYQVTKDNYLSQGGTISRITSSQTLDITLQPFSTGNWTDISSTAEKVADYFVVDGSGKFNGPYTTWCHWIVPATPGKKYRITATAGQSARLWGFYVDKPVSDGSVKPISVSSNSGMTEKIADEVIAPEGTVYLVVNNRISSSSDTTAIIEVLN